MRKKLALVVAPLLAVAGGGISLSPAAAAPPGGPPADSNFQKVTLNDFPGEPIEPRRAARPAGAAHRPHRRGADPRPAHRAATSSPPTIPVYQHDEEGLQGVAIDPDFARNKWVYLYYSPPLNTPGRRPGHPGRQRGRRAGRPAPPADFAPFKGALRLSRFKLRRQHARPGHRAEDHRGGHRPRHLLPRRRPDRLRRQGQPLPVHRRRHQPVRLRRLRADRRAGRPQPGVRRAAHRRQHQRPARQAAADQGQGRRRLHHPGAATCSGRARAKTRPEIYAMGLRNPFRFAVDRRTDDGLRRRLLAGRAASRTRRADRPGTAGGWRIDKPANYGWPYCVTPDAALRRLRLRHRHVGRAVQLRARRSTTRRTTPADRVLPPVEQPEVFYSYGAVGASSRSWAPAASARWAARRTTTTGAATSRTKWPAVLRRRAAVLRVDPRLHQGVPPGPARRRSPTIEPVLPSLVFDNPMDMEFGPDGALYVLEYGDGYFAENPDAQLARIDFVRGNRTPIPVMAEGNVPIEDAPLPGDELVHRAIASMLHHTVAALGGAVVSRARVHTDPGTMTPSISKNPRIDRQSVGSYARFKSEAKGATDPV